MPKIFYYSGIQAAHLKDYSVVLQALANHENTPGTKVEKLRGHDIYSLRINIKGRILFTYFPYDGNNHLLVLEILEEHQYDQSKFLRTSVLKRFLRENAEEIIAGMSAEQFEEAEPPALPVKEPAIDFNYVPIHLGHETLVFDEAQAQALSQKAPLIIQGPPGSGKTSLAFAFLLDGIMNKGFERVLYVTQSKHLCEQMQKDWESHPEYVEHRDNIEILAYEDLFKAANKEFSWNIAQSERVFSDWLETDKKQHKKHFRDTRMR